MTQPGDVNAGVGTTAIFVLLLLIAVSFRLPWFFQDVIDWDESVFILVGDALAHGHLPYTLVWDNKPPLGFAFFAFIIAFLPDSLAFVRFGGAVLVALSALLVFRIATGLMGRRAAFLAATFFIIAVSVLVSSGPAVMMEHVALMPLLGALSLIDNKTSSHGRLLVIGVLLGAATMVRTNLAYVLLSVLLLLPFAHAHRSLRERALVTVYIASGSLIVFGAIFLVYAVNGYGKLLVDSAIRVPLAYSESALGYLDVGKAMLGSAFRFGWQGAVVGLQWVLNALFWVAGLAGVALLVVMERHRNAASTMILVFLAATLLSILSSGYPWGHYLLQLAPFFAIGAGLVVSTAILNLKRSWLVVIIGATVIGFTADNVGVYRVMLMSHAKDGEVYRGVNFELARYLRNVSEPEDTLFTTDDILLYWLMDTYPVVPVAAFPANLWMEQAVLKPLYGPAATTEAVLEEIVSRQPTRIILPEGRVGSRGDIDTRQAFPRELLDDYHLERVVAGRLIYRRD